MIENVFTQVVCVKKWNGCLYERAKAIRHLASIPHTSIMIESLTGKGFFEPYHYLNEESRDVAAQIAGIISSSIVPKGNLSALSGFLRIGFNQDIQRGNLPGEMEINLVPFVSHYDFADFKL